MEVGQKMVFDETELRLGLPGAKATEVEVVIRKRGFSETETETETTTVDLMLNLSPKELGAAATAGADPQEKPNSPEEKPLLLSDSAKPPPAK